MLLVTFSKPVAIVMVCHSTSKFCISLQEYDNFLLVSTCKNIANFSIVQEISQKNVKQRLVVRYKKSGFPKCLKVYVPKNLAYIELHGKGLRAM
jgi:hypothetical protein